MDSSPFDSDVDFVVAKGRGTKLAGWQKFSYALLIIMVLLCTGAIVAQQRQLTTQERQLTAQARTIEEGVIQADTIKQLQASLTDAKAELDNLKKRCGKDLHRKPVGSSLPATNVN